MPGNSVLHGVALAAAMCPPLRVDGVLMISRGVLGRAEAGLALLPGGTSIALPVREIPGAVTGSQ
jgi:hypothetical protein